MPVAQSFVSVWTDTPPKYKHTKTEKVYVYLSANKNSIRFQTGLSPAQSLHSLFLSLSSLTRGTCEQTLRSNFVSGLHFELSAEDGMEDGEMKKHQINSMHILYIAAYAHICALQIHKLNTKSPSHLHWTCKLRAAQAAIVRAETVQLGIHMDMEYFYYIVVRFAHRSRPNTRVVL